MGGKVLKAASAAGKAYLANPKSSWLDIATKAYAAVDMSSHSNRGASSSAPVAFGWDTPTPNYVFESCSHKRHGKGLLLKVGMEPWATIGASATFAEGVSFLYDRSNTFRSVMYLDPTDTHFGRVSEFVSAAFARYRFRNFRLTYVPGAVQTASNVAVGLVGSDDALNPNIQSGDLAKAFAAGLTAGPCWTTTHYDIDLSFDDTLYYTFAAGSTDRLSFQGKFTAVNAGASVTLSGRLGFVYATYELELYDAHPPYSSGPTLVSILRPYMDDEEKKERVREPVPSVGVDPPPDTVYTVVNAMTRTPEEYIVAATHDSGVLVQHPQDNGDVGPVYFSPSGRGGHGVIIPPGNPSSTLSSSSSYQKLPGRP